MRIFKRLLSVFFVLYCVSLATTMAGMETFGYGLAIFVFAYMALNWKNPSVHFPRLSPNFSVEWAMILMVLVAIVGAIASPHLPVKDRIDCVGQQRWMLLLYALTACLAVFSLDNPNSLPKAFWILFVCFAVAVLFGIFQSLFNVGFFFRPAYTRPPATYGPLTIYRARGFFSNCMSFAYSLGQVACFAFAFALAADIPPKIRRLLYAFFIWFVIGICFTFTRGAWLGSILAFVAMGLLWNKKVGIQIIVAIAALIAIGSIVSPGVRFRLKSIFHTHSDVSIEQRFQVWRVNLQMFKDHPLFGIGYGYNYYYTPEYNLKVLGHPGFNGNAHDNYLEVLAGSGIFGFVLWLFICGYFFWRTWILYRNSSNGSWAKAIGLGGLGAQIFFHFGGLTQTTFFDAKNVHVLMLGWAFVLAHDIANRRSANRATVIEGRPA